MDRSMSKRLSASLAVVALLVLACGGTAPSPTPKPSTGPTTGPSVAPTTAPTAAPTSCQSDTSKTPIEIQGWWTTGGEADGFNKIIAMFNDAHPDLCVYNAAIAGGAGSVAQGRIKAAVLAGLPPDTFQVHMGHEL